jgi:tetratricopeptide (TPR) repeat protein
MLTKKIRYIIIVINILLGIIFAALKLTNGALTLFFAAAIVVIVEIKYSSVYAAFKSMQRNDIEKTKQLLSETKNPDTLSKSYKGYYYWILAYINTGEQDLSSAVENYHKALHYGLRTNNDTAIIHYNLALLSFLANQRDIGNEYLHKAKELNPKTAVVDLLTELEKIVKNSTDLTKSIGDYITTK